MWDLQATGQEKESAVVSCLITVRADDSWNPVRMPILRSTGAFFRKLRYSSFKVMKIKLKDYIL